MAKSSLKVHFFEAVELVSGLKPYLDIILLTIEDNIV